MSNVLALPHALVTVQTGNNESWVESFKFVVDDGSGDTNTMPQLDLRGMSFQMEMRRQPEDYEVILSASTDDLKLSIGAFPNVGFLLLSIPVSEMETKTAGTYYADIVALDAQFQRKCMTMTVTIIEGVTR